MSHKERNKGEGDRKQSYSLPHVTSDKRQAISAANSYTSDHQTNEKTSVDMSRVFALLDESVMPKNDSKLIANNVPKPKWNYSQNKQSATTSNAPFKVEYAPSAATGASSSMSPLGENTQIAIMANRRKTQQPAAAVAGNFTKGKSPGDTITQGSKGSLQESTDRRNRELGQSIQQGQCNNCAQQTLQTIQEELRRTSQFARQKSSILSQNKENLQRDLLRIQDIKVLQQAKDQTITRNLDAKQIMQLKRLLVPYANSASHASTLNGSIRQNQTTMVKQPEIDCLESQQSSVQKDMEKKKNAGSLSVHMQSTSRGRGTKKILALQQQQQQYQGLKDDSCIMKKMNISYNEDYLVRDERSPVNRSQPLIVLRDPSAGNGVLQTKKMDPSPLRSQLATKFSANNTNKNSEKNQGCEEGEKEQQEEEDEDNREIHHDHAETKKWMKLQVDGNKINNVPSNIEFEINRIQKLAEKNELAMQEFVAVRSKVISINSKVKSPSSSLSMSLQQ